ncbi:polysaccharide pyruvyl transferase family protein [Paenarthrobacter sp. NPDC057355]|uniref:polysaccharide pyruvyl transferase family protein n=1 Tax=Paenarthrobacter sp. NPDC057355 TaxID=3346105 RepID=UPI003630CBD3
MGFNKPVKVIDDSGHQPPPTKMSTMNPLNCLQDEARGVLTSILPAGTRVALLDFPRHQNAGDSFIWLGALAYFKQLGVRVDYVADIFCFDPSDLRKRLPKGPILITGGGNFGDRWMEHQAFRERIVSEFPDRQIIQLPQSLDFESKRGLERAQRVLNAHENLTLMFRQTADMERAAKWFPTSRHVYCPDLALGLGQIDRPRQASCDVLLLLRNDSESITRHNLDSFAQLAHEVTDWRLSGISQLLWLAYRLPENVARVLSPFRYTLQSVIAWTYLRAARLNLEASAKTLSRGRVVVTDRLHGMFLGALLGIPTIAMDNANGKVAAIFSDYMSNFDNIHMVDSLDEAAEKATEILVSEQRYLLP